MSRWLLAPTNHRSEIWKSYRMQQIVVDVPDEGEARQQVAKRAATKGSAPTPWLDPALTFLAESRRKVPAGTGTKENEEAQSDAGRLKSSFDPAPQ